jgi:6-phosphogluconate dehydrogenase
MSVIIPFHFVSFQALYASKIVSYAQGFMLLREAAKQYNWTLNYGGIALMWRGGCIIRR